jgi:hypothetical protein
MLVLHRYDLNESFNRDPAATLKDNEPPQCALRGRYLWLDRRLHFDPARLPPQPCVAFDEWRAAIDPAGVTLVFPEAYMNNPSSMFGHTLLRIDSATGKDLLAYGSNYSADTGGDGGVAFAFKGILGYYDGRFAIYPYYDIIRQYGDWEQRDIWEYPLTFDADQTALLLAHLWELRGVTFDYYFFDENCSYELLGLIQAVRPEADLQGRFHGWAIPIDTLRAVLEQAGLASDTFELCLNGKYGEREHVCQYEESDLAFVERWIEREGMYYFFEHGETNALARGEESPLSARGERYVVRPGLRIG